MRLQGIPPNGPVHSYLGDPLGTVVGFKESKLYRKLKPPITVDTLKPPPTP
jgi:hypothetical protein